MMGSAPLEPEFKTLQEKNYPKNCFHFRSVWGQYLRGGRFPPPPALELIGRSPPRLGLKVHHKLEISYKIKFSDFDPLRPMAARGAPDGRIL